jgi:predicted RNA-binding protein with PIN domain
MLSHEQRDADFAAQAAKTLIDGYNLMYAAGIVGQKRGPRGLEHSRAALLNVLAESLPSDEAQRTVVVFDAQRPPPGLPHTTWHRGLIVYFASNHEDADALMEELIARHSAPRQLTVVSSDHRLQRAARRRRARAVDSDVWYEELLRRRSELRRGASRSSESASSEPPEDVEFWLREFQAATERANELPLTDDVDPNPPTSQGGVSLPAPKPSHGRATKRRRPSRRVKNKPPSVDTANPFPPGYCDDLFDEDGERGASAP